ncbi:MAG: hypothetical protein L6U16_03910 [Porphyromonadaceae bacterium]|nr:MAG: hypothetical protein L6U16_03910 [Porphyromonadaceae bacterium]
MWIASKHAKGMSLRYDESLNLTPSFKTQNTQLTAVPQKRLLFYLPPQFWQVIFQNYLPKLRKIPSFWQVISKIICQNKEKNIEFWQVIYKIVCQNPRKKRYLCVYLMM